MTTTLTTTETAQARALLEATVRESVERQCNQQKDAIAAAGWDLDAFKAELFRRQFPKLLAEARL